jgi:hypothetical protein
MNRFCKVKENLENVKENLENKLKNSSEIELRT